MIARTVSELIATWYGRDQDEFRAVYVAPVLVGVGVLDVKLLRDPHRHGNTLCLGFEHATSGRADPPPNALVGIILPLVPRGGGDRPRLLVGRRLPADIIVDDPSVSERHCALEWRGKTMMVTDLGSTNGTLINGTPLEPPLAHTLRDEDILTLGRHSFQFFTPDVLFTYLQLSPPPQQT
jgi:hypothetical protein